MQHNTQHAPRAAPPHLRGGGGSGGHHMSMHPSAAVGGGPLPPSTRQKPLNTSVPPPQHQHNIPNNSGGNVASATVTLQPPDQHLREHINRLFHHQQPQQHPQTLQSSSQMQKIRQQHQHLNVNSNNNAIKTNHHHQQYNQANAQQQHLGVTHQQHQLHQRNVPALHPQLQQQQQQHIQQLKNHMQHSSNSNINRQQQPPPVLPTATPQSQAQSQQQQQSKKNPHKNNKRPPLQTNFFLPKSILQNPNRPLNKSRLQVEPATAVAETPSQDVTNVVSVATTTDAVDVVNSNNITLVPDDLTAPVVSATVGDVVLVPAAPNAVAAIATPSVSEPTNDAPIIEAAMTEDKETNNVDKSCAATSTNDSDDIPKSIDTILPNVDTSVPKNSKEKTPMCLVNELARFNKITHQYRLTCEIGPAHCKRFTVTLKLGDEEYSAEGFKIKKAQHLAASDAIERTKYKHPLPKTNRRTEDGVGVAPRANITPTVELNALAMKLGQQTYYLFDPRQVPPPDIGGAGVTAPPLDGSIVQPPPYGVPPGHMLPPQARILDPAPYMRRNGGGYGPRMIQPPPHQPHQRYGPQRGGGGNGFMPKYSQRGAGGYPMMPPHLYMHNPHFAGHAHVPPGPPIKITLIVGKQKFIGIGRTLQQAKHDAAAQALQVLKTQTTNQQLGDMLNSSAAADEAENDSKSPISLVHEIGIKRSLTVHFKVLREEGPAHMKNFITACIVGTLVTEGEGNGKKISKKRAAEKMLDELKKLPPLTPIKSPAKRIKIKTPGGSVGASGPVAIATPIAKGSGVIVAAGTVVERRKRPGASIKERPAVAADDMDAENPITKLIQLAQNRKEKEPVFELIARNGNEQSRRREFIIEVTSQGMVARGTGYSKKLAKRVAAQNLLITMGVEKGPEEEASKSQTESTTTNGSNSLNTSVEAPAVTNQNSIIQEIDTISGATSVAATLTVVTTVAPTTTPTTAPPGTFGNLNLRDLPLISTSAGQVPGILILRQNKKHPSKKREIAPTNTLAFEATSTKKHEPPQAAPEVRIAAPPAARASVVAPRTVAATPTVPTAVPVAAVPAQAVVPAQATIPAPAAVAAPASVIVPASVIAPASVIVADPVQRAELNPPCVSLRTAPTTSAASSAGASINANSTASSVVAAPASTADNKGCSGVSSHMKRQLEYLSSLLGFEVNFSDYPKGNHNEFLTIVTISTNPPQICHGVGTSTEESQNDAAKNALKILRELGLG